MKTGLSGCPARTSLRRPDERGSGSMLMVGVMAVVLMLGLAAICIAGYLMAAHRVRAAADLAALSGAVAVNAGQDGCTAARRTARDNGARLATCERVGDQVDFVITVRAELPVHPVPGLPASVQAVAFAGPGRERGR
jgi:secretion/DNA translocation related TadE-like protein